MTNLGSGKFFLPILIALCTVSILIGSNYVGYFSKQNVKNIKQHESNQNVYISNDLAVEMNKRSQILFNRDRASRGNESEQSTSSAVINDSDISKENMEKTVQNVSNTDFYMNVDNHTVGIRGRAQTSWNHNNNTSRGQDSERSTSSMDIANINKDSIANGSLKLPTPILVMGMPKSGTTSIFHFFNCSGIATSHYCCSGPNTLTHFPCKGGFQCSSCIRKNVEKGQPPLDGCGIGTYDVFAQMDGEGRDSKRGGILYMPQVVALDAIHKSYPEATFILNLRDPDRWVDSVTRWFNLKGILRNTDIPEYNFPKGVGKKKLELRRFYVTHTEQIRNFVREHPTHNLVEVEIESENAGKVMAKAFGLSEECWENKNQNIKNPVKK